MKNWKFVPEFTISWLQLQVEFADSYEMMQNIDVT